MRYLFLLVFFIFLVALGTYILSSKSTVEKAPVVLNPIDVNPELVDSLLHGIGHGHKIQDFTFVNQYGEIITNKTVHGKVYVVDYFFTTCGSICPIMTGQMKRVQAAFLNNNDFLILSHTVWPEVDTVEQMLRYGKEKGVVHGKWHLLTGNKEQLYDLARKSYFVLKPIEAEDVGDGNSDFIHTNNFVLVDKKRQIRGYYDGTDSLEVAKLIRDIEILLKE
jgi:protein SCO1/2